MRWSTRYATGIDFIDEQHKMLFKMSEDYHLALAERRGERVYGLALKNLAAYAHAHFGMEEQCMERYRCPVAAINREAHGRFVDALSEFQERYAANGFTIADAQELVQYVDGWLASHIGRIDVQLKLLV